jgi:hypothetical protein
VRTALPQPASKWNAREPECWECVHCARVPNGPYAMAVCRLMPEFLPFGLHWKACRKFQKNPNMVKYV